MADYLRECIASTGIQGSDADFVDTFCKRCRNADCQNAQWAGDKFTRRVSTQVDRLFNPLRMDPTMPKYAQIAAAEFKDMLREAMVLEISAQRNDWSVPEVPIRDGVPETSDASDVDAAVKALQGLDETDVPLDDPEPSMDDPEPSMDDPEVAEPAKVEAPVIRTAPIVPTLRGPVVKQVPKAGNTHVPAEGIMLGGEPAPAVQPKLVIDPWAAPEPGPKIQPTGVRIQFGDNGEIK